MAGDTIFNFTTINIGAGVTVRLDSRNLSGPVYWLATGAVTIAGTLDLSGGVGHQAGSNGIGRTDRVFSIPGAGGFPGGPGSSPTAAAEPGAGPGGGTVPTANNNDGRGGIFTGSQYLIPLIGGSGGSGAFNNTCAGFAAGGGAGGGAILIASSTSITITGTVNAAGGSGSGNVCMTGGGGSGGAIRLVAPTISVGAPPARVIVSGGGGVQGGSGFIRFEAFQVAGVVSGTNVFGPFSTSTPNQLALPASSPVVKVSSIAGIAINANPFTFPDVTINTISAVPVVVQAQNVPPGAVPTLYILSETGPDQVIAAPALQGTLQSSSSTVNITYPPGGSRGLVRLTWTQ